MLQLSLMDNDMKQYLTFMVWFKKNYAEIYERYWRNIEIGNSNSPLRINNTNISENAVFLLQLVLSHYNNQNI